MRPLVRKVDRLQHLAAFEAAGRLGSFTAAGAELGMTQPAVTRHVQTLETLLGVMLFHRSSNRIALTEAGQRLLDSVDVGFSTVEAALDEIGERAEVFVLAAPPGFAQQLVMPVLDAYRAALGDRDLWLWVYEREPDLVGGTFEAAIRLGSEDWNGFDSLALFPEEVFPVASPVLAQEWGLHEQSPAADVLAAPLLHMEATDRPWMDWNDWLRHFDLALTPGRKRVRFNNYPAVLQQVVAGKGVALGWRGLVDELLADEILVRVGSSATSGRHYSVTWPHGRSSPDVEAVVDELVRSVGGQPPQGPDRR